ncbi:MAG: hypothetical protein MRY57_00215 [Candidatus Pacebacteria bacterium]|nr:hypothetical protein [Candidatus Paceibacterota bacterium]
MDLEEMMQDSGFGELDRFVFSDKSEYAKYFEYLSISFQALIRGLGKMYSESEIDQHEQQWVLHSLMSLFQTFELIELKHLYDKDHGIRVDVTESSFLHHGEIRQMEVDYDCLDQLTEHLPSSQELKEKVLIQLRKLNKEPIDLLQKLARREYFDRLDPHNLFFLFNRSKLHFLSADAEKKRAQYMLFWSVYDSATNRPILYSMHFEYSYRDELMLEQCLEEKEQLLELITQAGRKINRLGDFGETLDVELTHIHPKLIKRIDLGPIFGHYSKDEHSISQFFHRHNFKPTDSIIWFEIQKLVSVGEKKTRSKFFNAKTILQEFEFSQDIESMRNKVSDIEYHLVAPHHVMQYLYDDEEEMKTIIRKVGDNITTFHKNEHA